MPDLAWLRHPSERSRAKRLEPEQVIWTMVVGPVAAALAAAPESAFAGLTSGVKRLRCSEEGAYEGGHLACWEIDGATVLAWTDDSRQILALAQRDSGPI